MGSKAAIAAFCLALSALLNACTQTPELDGRVSVTLISGAYTLADGYAPQLSIRPGEEVRFVLYPQEGYVISGTDYPGGIATEGVGGSSVLILPKVRYPTRVHVLCEKDNNVQTIIYQANGGTSTDGTKEYTVHHSLNGHLYSNTKQVVFEKENCTLLCWNTRNDGSGTSIGLGSRCPETGDNLTLYAQWAPWSAESVFQFQPEDGGYTLTRYLGEEENVTIPGKYQNLPVKKISSHAFEDCRIQRLSLPLELETVENEAFIRCSIRELYLFDRVQSISDSAFSDTSIPNVHMNAAQPPRYAGSGRMSTYADKVDLLRSHADQKKIVIFGGSGTYYSVLAAYMQELLENDYYVLNMGTNAWFPAEPQLAVIRPFLLEGDVLLHIPEESSPTQLFSSSAFALPVHDSGSFDDRFFRSLELNYDLITLMDLNESSGFFDSFSRFNRARQSQEFTEYAAYSHYINENGDYPGVKLAYGTDAAITHEAAICPELLTQEACSRMNRIYASFEAQGVQVAIAFAAVNESALQEDPDYLEKSAQFESLLRQNLRHAAVLGEISDSFYPGSVFYNSDWHLSEEADTENTAAITENLLALLNP